LSLDASQRSPMLVDVIVVHAMPCGTDGGCVSAVQALVLVVPVAIGA
jgi:hypothetical protein